jgi:hypothetical protein
VADVDQENTLMLSPFGDDEERDEREMAVFMPNDSAVT